MSSAALDKQSFPKTSIPYWLRPILEDHGEPPRLYAWSGDNLTKNEFPANRFSPLAGSANDTTTKHRIYVLGIGNLGRLFASSLAKLPQRPAITLVVHRKALLEQWLSSPGIEIIRSGQSEHNTQFEVEWWTDERPNIGPVRELGEGNCIRNLIISTKASDAMPQADKLRRYLDCTSTVAFVQNGMCKLWPPTGDLYSNHRFPHNQGPNWIACVTSHGVTSLGPFSSLHASPANVYVGPVSLNPRTAQESDYLIQQISDAPNLAGCRFSRSDLWIAQLEKLVVNSVINPLTAILGCKNGELFMDRTDQLPNIIDMLIREASSVLRVLVMCSGGIEPMTGRPQQPISIRDVLLERFSFSRLRKLVLEVGHKVGENTSSMLQDTRAGKHTEIQDFNGWLVDTARYLDPDLNLPFNRRIIKLVEERATISRAQLTESLFRPAPP